MEQQIAMILPQAADQRGGSLGDADAWRHGRLLARLPSASPAHAGTRAAWVPAVAGMTNDVRPEDASPGRIVDQKNPSAFGL